MKVAVCVEAQPSRAALGATALATGLVGADVWWVHVGSAAMDVSQVPQEISGVMSLVAPELENAHSSSMAVALAAVIARLGCALVLCGVRSDAEGTGLIGAALAVQMERIYIAQVSGLSWTTGRKHVEADVALDGQVVRLRVELPAVLTCVPVAAAVGATRIARQHKILSLQDVRIDPATMRKASAWVSNPVPQPRPKSVKDAAAFMHAITKRQGS